MLKLLLSGLRFGFAFGGRLRREQISARTSPEDSCVKHYPGSGASSLIISRASTVKVLGIGGMSEGMWLDALF